MSQVYKYETSMGNARDNLLQLQVLLRITLTSVDHRGPFIHSF